MLTALVGASEAGAGAHAPLVARVAVMVWERARDVPARLLLGCPPALLHEWTWQPARAADPFMSFQRLCTLVIDGAASRSPVGPNDLQALCSGADLPAAATACGYEVLDSQGASPRGVLKVPMLANVVGGAHAVVEELVARMGLSAEVTETTPRMVRFTFEEGSYYAVWDSSSTQTAVERPRFRVLAERTEDPLLERLVRVLLASGRLPEWSLRGDDAFYRSALAFASPATLSHLFWPDPTATDGSYGRLLDWLDQMSADKRLAEVVVRGTLFASAESTEDPFAVSWHARNGRLAVSCELTSDDPAQRARVVAVGELLGVALSETP